VRFIIMHKTNARWEAGEIPSPELIGRVGALMGELAKAGVLQAGEGLRASAEGARLRVSGGKRTVTPGPFPGDNELPAGFTILRAESLDQAIDWASREASVLGDGELEIRPVTEAWDIGLVPKPPSETTRRYMVLRKATAASEEGAALTPGQRSELAHLVEASRRTGVHLAREDMRPSARGRRYKNSRKGISVTDGPFTESKELIAGYVIVKADSLDDAGRLAERYLDVVEADEVDVRELEDAPAPMSTT
jgi:hypothetical protein